MNQDIIALRNDVDNILKNGTGGTMTPAQILSALLGVDGAGSGLDADLLDGLEASAFLLASAYTASDILNKIKTIDGAGSGLDADLLDGNEAAAFLLSSAYTASDVLTKIKTVDGTGSGLDADLLDGNEYSAITALINARAKINASSYSSRTGYIQFENGVLIQWGYAVITPVANTPTYATVNFSIAYTQLPTVMVTSSTSYTGSEVKEVAFKSLGSTSMQLAIYRTTTGNAEVYWLAVGQ